jgi:hypothetical protein
MLFWSNGMSETIIGIDPGKSGAIAILQPGEPLLLRFDRYELADIAAQLAVFAEDGDCFAMLEQVHSSPQMGVKSAFSFGQSVGQIEGLLQACKIPFDRVTPAKWQGVMKCRSKGDKNVTKKRAAELFPRLKMNHAIADALLIAEYGRRERLNAG